jgi:hypothetical protein
VLLLAAAASCTLKVYMHRMQATDSLHSLQTDMLAAS